jgi:septal ring factor EnvC (AmiA/AmiB activator)
VDDHESTTGIYKRVGLAWLPRALRGRLTPATLGSAVVALAIAIGYVLTAQHDLRTAQHDIDRQSRSIDELQQQLELLHNHDTQIAVMNSKLDDMSTEVDRQRERWERIEGIAELPPHPRRRR